MEQKIRAISAGKTLEIIEHLKREPDHSVAVPDEKSRQVLLKAGIPEIQIRVMKGVRLPRLEAWDTIYKNSLTKNK